MEERFKQRLVGAAVLVALAVIFVPMLLDVPIEPDPPELETRLPEGGEEEFSSRIVSLDEPSTPILDEAARLDEEPSAGERSEAGEEPPVAAEGSGDTGGVPSTWAVQLGSFSQRENALVLQNRLLVMGYASFTESAKAGQAEVTRVLVGPEAERDRAESIARTLAREIELEGMVVRRPRNPKG